MRYTKLTTFSGGLRDVWYLVMKNTVYYQILSIWGGGGGLRPILNVPKVLRQFLGSRLFKAMPERKLFFPLSLILS